MMAPTFRRGRGFTLVEILVALVVLGIVGGALLELFHGSLRNVALSGDYTHAALLARSKLAELEAREQFGTTEEAGAFDEQYRWHLRAADYVAPDGSTPPSASVRPVQVALSIVWDDGAHERRYSVETLLLARATGDER